MKKFIVLIILLVLMCGIYGCKKKTAPAETAPEAKAAEQYKAEAKKTINTENMDKELEKLEQEIEADIEN